MKNSLKYKIRKNLLETKENKKRNQIKVSLIENNLKFITKGISNKEQFNKLSDNKKLILLFKIAEELNPIVEDKLINEQLGDLLSGIFGKTLFTGLGETFVEGLLGSLFNKVGITDSYIRKAMISFIASDPRRIWAALSDCKELTKLLAESFLEAYAMKLQQDKGVDNVFFDSIRNILGDLAKDTNVISSIENAVSGKVCEIFNMFTGRAKNVMSALKGSSLAPTG